MPGELTGDDVIIAWVLFDFYAEAPLDRERLNHLYDAYNRGRLSDDELDAVLLRLSGHGLAELESDAAFPTDSLREMCRELQRRPDPWVTFYKPLCQKLGVECPF